MNFSSVTKNALAILAIIAVFSFSFAGHSTAVSRMNHELSNHRSGDNGSCALQCRTAIINEDKNALKDQENQNDNEPHLSILIQDRSFFADDKTHIAALYAEGVKPPPKIPIYLLLSISRT